MKYAYLIIAIFLLGTTGHAQVANHLYPCSQATRDGFSYKYKYCYRNDSNRIVIGYLFDQADKFINGRARVMVDRKWGIIDTLGNYIIPPIYSDLMNWNTKYIYSARINNDSVLALDSLGHIICTGVGEYPYIYENANRIIINNRKYGAPVTSVVYNCQGRKILQLNKGDTYSIATGAPGNGRYCSKAMILLRGNTHYDALTDSMGKVLVDSIETVGFYDGYAILRGVGKACIIDSDLHIVVPLSAGYTDIRPLGRIHAYNVKKNGKWGVITPHLDTVVPFNSNEQLASFDTLRYIIKDPATNMFVCRLYNGKKLFESFEPVDLYPSLPLPVALRISKTRWQYWNNGFIGTPAESVAALTSDGFGYMYKDGIKSITSTHGKVVFSGTPDWLTPPVDGIIGIGTKISGPAGAHYRCALWIATVNGSYTHGLSYSDINGKPFIADTFETISPFVHGQAQVSKNCENYVINKKGQRLPLPGGYYYVSDTASGVYVVQNGEKKQALADAKGNVISPWVTSVKMKDGLPVFYDFFEKERSEYSCKYHTLLPDFNHGLVIVEKDNGFGLMDSTGRIITTRLYKSIDTWNGLCYRIVSADNEKLEGALDRKGREIAPPVYNRVGYYNAGTFLVEKDDTRTQEVLKYEP